MLDDTFDEKVLEEAEEVEEWVAPYGLSDIKSIECRNEDGVVVQRKVTDKHRIHALSLTDSETLECFDAGVQQVAPGLRRYGQTFASIVQKFQEERGVIRDEMARIAVKNLTAVVSQKPGTFRILNFEIAVATKKTRDRAPQEEAQPKNDDPISFLND